MPDTMQVMAPEPPRPTYTGGSAVMSATDEKGQEWIFDNAGGTWVNSTTGESLTPSEFSQKSGGNSNAADNTRALAASMRRAGMREEGVPQSPLEIGASGETSRPKVVPVAAPSAPMAPVRPPVAVAPPMGITPPATPLPPAPRRYVNPEQLAGVKSQKPVPSTIVPPAPEQLQAFKQNMAQWLVDQQGWKPKEAMGMVGLNPPSTAKPVHVGAGGSLVDPMTGKVLYTAPPREMTDLQKAKEARLSAAAAMAGPRRAPEDTRDYTANATRMATITKELDQLSLIDPKLLTKAQYDKMADLTREWGELRDAQAQLKSKYTKAAITAPTTGTTNAPALKPATVTAPTNAPAMAGLSSALPLPKDKANLVAGRTYQTKRGLAKWDGKQFVAVE